MAEDGDLFAASGSDQAEARARAEVALRRLPEKLQRPLAWALSQWPGRIAIRSALASVQLGIFDRSMTLAAQFFTSVLPLLIITATWSSNHDGGWLTDLLHVPKESTNVIQGAISGAGGTAFGVVGLLMVLVSATSLSRALSRAFSTIWNVSRPKSTIGSAWRWMVVVVVLALALVAVRALTSAAGEVPPAALWRSVVSLLCDLAIAVFVPWLLLEGTLKARLLVPGGLLFAAVMVFVRPASGIWLPWALESSAKHYGAMGVAFTYLAYLYMISFIFLAASVLGHTIAVDRGSLGTWIRGPVEAPGQQPAQEHGQEHAGEPRGQAP